jgi:hypothetical protein
VRSQATVCGRRLPIAQVVRACRSCGSHALREVLELGMVPTAGSLYEVSLTMGGDRRSPLVLVFCLECALVQTLPGVPVHRASEHELRRRRSSDDRDDGDDRLALVSSRALGTRSLVVEIGSGDGRLLESLAADGITVLGVERSTAAAFSAAAAGVPTITDPFDRDLATKLRAAGLDADVIVVSCLIDAVDGLNRFVEGLRILVADHGAIVVETPYVLDLLDRVALGAVSHGRRSYFSCTSLDALVRRHGLFLNDVEVIATGDVDRLRCRIEPREAITDRCESMLDAEHRRGAGDPGLYATFQHDVTTVLDALTTILRSVRAAGHSVAALGADRDIVTLLNAAAFGPDLVDFVVDTDSLLHGMHIPGVGVPIVSPRALESERCDFLLTLEGAAERTADPVVASFLSNGGRLIVVQPSPRVVGAAR